MTLYTVRTGFSVFKNGVSYIGGQSVDLTPEQFQAHKHKLENTSSTVMSGTYSQGGNNGGQYTAISLNISAQTWTDFGSTTEVKEWQVLEASGRDMSDSFEYRQFEGQWQIFSLTAQNNLQIILEK